ncbi:MAG: hypothetical protein IPM33_08370 [Phycisphaerales bacterium]|nr:hypothetical protein [Phycisphaerales bacterium]
MVRSILAVVITYIAMSVLIVGVFAGLWLGLGPDRLLEPGSWKGNLFFSIAAPSITVLAGLIGGCLCARIGRGRGPVIALAAIVFVLGMAMCMVTIQKPYPADPREPGLTMTQIMEQGREPTWLAVLNPIIGAGAVLLSGLSAVRKRMGTASPARGV